MKILVYSRQDKTIRFSLKAKLMIRTGWSPKLVLVLYDLMQIIRLLKEPQPMSRVLQRCYHLNMPPAYHREASHWKPLDPGSSTPQS